MHRCFVVVSGLPGSGKSTLARQLALALGLPLLDKDGILERLFELRGVGDARWRQTLSRESDVLLQAEAVTLDGAVLVSHWRLPGMSPDSGTPTDWLTRLPGKIIHIHCECSAEVAAERFVQRKRHLGHLDGDKSGAEILSGIRRIAGFGRLDIGPRIDVETSRAPDVDAVVRQVRSALDAANR